MTPPFFITSQAEVPSIEELEAQAASVPATGAAVGDVLKGSPGSPGVARGRARVVMDPADPDGLEPGEVLIAPLTDPAWTPLFLPAAAVVVNVGALMSHAVIVSREDKKKPWRQITGGPLSPVLLATPGTYSIFAKTHALAIRVEKG